MNAEDIHLRCSTLYLHAKRPKIQRIYRFVNHQVYPSETWTANANYVSRMLKQIIS